MQGDLFSASTPPRKTILGHSEISYARTASILTKTSGFMEGYDFSLNPYSGCSFGCTYCYAAFFVRDKQKMDSWGHWVSVKENSLDLLKKLRKKPLINKTVYMSSVTDPYQPIERDLELTRSLLKEFLDYHQVRMVVQTRSQLAVRDIDLFKKFKVIQVNMTITTDSERIRKVFEPFCPSNKIRMKSIKEIHDAGVRSCITLTPLLPLESPEQFSRDLIGTGIEKYIIQPFHPDRGKFVAGTREEARKLLNEFKWSENEYNRVFEIIRKHIPEIGVGKQGFAPI